MRKGFEGRFEAKPHTPKAELAPGGGTENEEFAVVDPETGEAAEKRVRTVPGSASVGLR